MVRAISTFIRDSFASLLRKRNIIVVCDERVQHYPISTARQLAILGGLILFVAWISYTAGSYMNAQKELRKKDEELYQTFLENRKIEQQFSLLRKDLVNMTRNSKNNGNLSEYDRFVISQYQDGAAFGKDFRLNDSEGESESDIASDKLLERVEYLENRITELESTNRALYKTVQQKTRNKISGFEKLIDEIGLENHRFREFSKIEKLEKDLQKQRREQQNASTSSEESKGIFSWLKENMKFQGGPYIPAEPTAQPDHHYQELMTEIDKMLVLRDLVNTLPLGRPMDDYARITSGFGRRIDPFRGRPAMHAGIDFAGRYGSNIYSTGSGKVIFAGRNGAYGLTIDIDHGNGIVTRYGHLSSLKVRPGQAVKRGTLIGKQGNTGRSTGTHLHYEVRIRNTAVNPLKFIKVDSDVIKD
jgi:murein DD-endopeptidase MepM/ murein hydrolase activator NlpD